LKYLSVASGIEAASVAWHPLAWEAVAFAEIDPFPCAVLSERWPATPNLGDMTKYREWKIDGSIDILVGGTPCQSFSVAGLRRGLDDPRGNLMLVYLAIARAFRPDWIVWENVPGVLSSNRGRAFGSFLAGLAELGYGWAYRVLDAQFFGVPQRRRRVFVVGYIGDWRVAASVLFERESVRGNPPPSRETGERVAPTISARPTAGGGLGADFDLDSGLIAANAEGDPGLPFLTRSNIGKGVNNQTPLIAHALRGEGFDASEDGTGSGTPIIPILEVGKRCGTNSDKRDGIGIGNPGDPMFTLQSGAQHGVMTHSVRRLTPREAERLQGFPDDYTLITYRGKPAADGPRYKSLGNSMAVPVMSWIGRRIEAVTAVMHEVPHV